MASIWWIIEQMERLRNGEAPSTLLKQYWQWYGQPRVALTEAVLK